MFVEAVCALRVGPGRTDDPSGRADRRNPKESARLFVR